ncbi:MAG: ferritin-like domain-containing protein [Actinobacteria bacterium]|nr:ferritin-like domain-containing protein [Actinomycetota bacterium]
MDNAKELFEHELRDIYDAEHKLVNALETMANKVGNEQLAKSFQEHRTVTQGHIERLDKVFGIIDRAPRREACDGINGLISEFSGFVKDESPTEPVLNVFATAAAIKVEHYEICSYKSLIKLADTLGLSEAAELFEQNLREEQETATELETMSEKLGHELPTS